MSPWHYIKEISPKMLKNCNLDDEVHIKRKIFMFLANFAAFRCLKHTSLSRTKRQTYLLLLWIIYIFSLKFFLNQTFGWKYNLKKCLHCCFWENGYICFNKNSIYANNISKRYKIVLKLLKQTVVCYKSFYLKTHTLNSVLKLCIMLFV